MNFLERQPSQNWEPCSIGEPRGYPVWYWIKPPGIPEGVVFQIPDETYRGIPDRSQLTVRSLLGLLGISASDVGWWSLGGATYPGQNGTSPLFDQPIPDPVPNQDSQIVVVLQTEAAAVTAVMTEPGNPSAPISEAESAPPDGDAAVLFARIETDWKASQLVESQLVNLRKNLAGMMMKLKSLNRDLSPEERFHADRKDKTDWQIARRWLRDAATRISKCLKDYDIGETSNAGQRERFQQMYEKQIGPRQIFDGLQQAQRDFESYRKAVQTLQTSMSMAHASAAQDGEHRAQQILKNIAASIRSARTKR